uniref:Transmembrane protein 131 n=1 Tax=Xiphophorus couchianus TaxID=32473 RepID=A0A3B5L6S7_9TELE
CVSLFLNVSSDKKAPGNKPSAGAPLPGKNGNPTFAAVAAGYDKSPGEFAPSLIPHSGLWSPINTASSPNYKSDNSFSAFGPNSSFNLTQVFSGMNLPKPSEPQPSWPEFTPAIWDMPSSDPLHSWPSSSGSPTAPTSFLGNTCSPWSATTPFSNSIWSTGTDSTLHPYSPSTGSPALTTLVSGAAPSPTTPSEMSRTFNPWSAWLPTLTRRSSEPWPGSSDTSN